MIDKDALFAALRAHLARELEVVDASAKAALEGATHEEAKPENEYDTRALEQSYLAGAQAARAEALQVALATVTNFRPPAFGDDEPVRVGAAVVVDDGAQTKNYLLCEVGGGTKLEVAGSTWWVLTPSSPLGRSFVGRRVGDEIERTIRGESVTLEILEVA